MNSAPNKTWNNQNKPNFKNVINIGSQAQPHSTDAEIAVLGGMMMSNKVIPKVLNLLGDSSVFYHEKHKVIFNSIVNLFDNKTKIDLITLSEELKRLGKLEDVGGAKYLLEIDRRTPSFANVEQHAIIVLDYDYKRKLIKASSEALNKAYDDTENILDVINEHNDKVKNIVDLKASNDPEEDTNAYTEYLNKIYSGKIKPVPTGLRGIDNIINGFLPADFVIIGARPGIGKTSLGITIAANMAYISKIPVLFITIEMSRDELMNRITSQMTMVPLKEIKTNKLDSSKVDRINNFLKNHAKSKLFIDHEYSDISKLVQAVRTRYSQEKVQYVVIDNFQNLTSTKKFNTETEKYNFFSNTLRALAKELQICIISLNQLNRNKDSRTKNDKQPMLSDIRNTGDLEQDAKIIIFIERPEMDGILNFSDGVSTEGVASITIAKNRDGRTGTTRMEYYAPCAKFQNYDPRYGAIVTEAALKAPKGFYHNPQEPYEEDNEPKF